MESLTKATLNATAVYLLPELMHKQLGETDVSMVCCAASPLQSARARDDAGQHTLCFCMVERGLGRRSVGTWQQSETAGK